MPKNRGEYKTYFMPDKTKAVSILGVYIAAGTQFNRMGTYFIPMQSLGPYENGCIAFLSSDLLRAGSWESQRSGTYSLVFTQDTVSMPRYSLFFLEGVS